MMVVGAPPQEENSFSCNVLPRLDIKPEINVITPKLMRIVSMLPIRVFASGYQDSTVTAAGRTEKKAGLKRALIV